MLLTLVVAASRGFDFRAAINSCKVAATFRASALENLSSALFMQKRSISNMAARSLPKVDLCRESRANTSLKISFTAGGIGRIEVR